MKVSVKNLDNKNVGEIELAEAVFGAPVRRDILARVVNWQLAKRRAGTHKTKGVSDIQGTTKKPWRQKGTGRARVGEIRNPLWRHGGTVFGPQPRSYDYALPRKVKLGALRQALAAKLADGTLVVVDSLASDSKKTKDTAAMFKKLGVTGKKLVIAVTHDDAFTLTARNIAGLTLKPSARVTARDVMDTDHVIATREALEQLQESLA